MRPVSAHSWLYGLLLTAFAAFAGPDIRLVTAEPAVRGVSLSGFTRARAQVRLVAETAGRVDEVFYDIGAQIGDEGVFARIDDTFIRLGLEEVQVQQERLRTLIDYDRREVKRYDELARQRNASASQLDTLEQTLRNNGHELRVLEVKERVLEERLQRARIRAPLGWHVTARSVEPGQWVGEGEPVGEVADFSVLLVPFALTAEQYAVLNSLSGDIRLALPDLGVKVGAAVYRTNPSFDPDTRKIVVDLEIRGQIAPHRGGLRARLTLPLPERTGAVMMPAGTLDKSYEEYWVTREDGERVRVTLLGPANGGGADLVRLASPSISPGDRFRLLQGD